MLGNGRLPAKRRLAPELLNERYQKLDFGICDKSTELPAGADY